MKNYVVCGEVTISVHTVVKANSIKEAIAIAKKRGLVTLHATWQDDPDSEWCATSDELDGEVNIITVDSEEPE